MFPFPDLLRLGRICAVLLRHGVDLVVGSRLRRWRWLARHLPADLSGPERLRTILEEIGGTFVKFGQMLAMQPDFVSLEYCDELFDLLDRIHPVEFADLREIFVEELGQEPEVLFDSFDRRPLATASIGQVHLGAKDGRRYAIKVQRPNVDREIAGDIRLMQGAIVLIRRLGLKRLTWIVEAMSEFITWTGEEMDYRNEARHMRRFAAQSRDNPLERIPAVLTACTTRRTLAVELLEGVTVLDYLRALEADDKVTFRRLERSGFDPDRFGRNIMANFLADVFRFGLFHADLHPANLLILPDNVVGYVDFGITGVLSPYSRRHLVAMTLAYTRGDLDGMCDAFLKISSMGRDADLDAFRQGMHETGEGWYLGSGRQQRLAKSVTMMMLDMLKLSRKAGIRPAKEVIKYVRSAITIDGLIARFAPAVDFGPALEDLCARGLDGRTVRDSLSFENMIDSRNSSARLVQDGAVRAAHLLDLLGKGEVPIRARVSASDEREGSLRRRALGLAGLAGTMSLLMFVLGEQAVLGVNLFTAEALLIGGSLAALGKTMWKLL